MWVLINGGGQPAYRRAVAVIDAVAGFLRQGVAESFSWAEELAQMQALSKRAA